ncbi:amine acid ABC transporter, permease protein, 3-TM region, His/Glu/Gln/Arg/opine family [Mesorhizobium australicum WSM2073]|uniref:Glutamate/aspartate import permease protein GltK n=3 Tax=Mesorhizobium TaxID=68287 RepID=L0KVE3_MESAW|nr:MULTISPECIES: amino acid ABC transporter permease [Mesorhizobium]ADV14784.1 polar amino acid ABC transporter, inner membrane subunit [Mesorhizobium ciceri biovar biserrulae WSM1271]AEH90671.1 polar amino acid ABC transporter, inner membrane subunit [Mesorhizobium opportunistum WSM2075]AGB48043.1 amine acid ABC transporter, permease protein, 3-TM region, His/Glu/Gln/Arg/opine family [Mesorhizobium australicum WSM2073]OBP90835.1 amino acid ABC transporter permease [Mesorhizobium loti]
MLYQDNVESEVLVHKPWFVASIFAVVLAVFLMFNLTGTTFGELMRPVIGDPAQSGIYGRFAIAFVIAIIFCLNIVLIGFVSLKVQIGVVWAELLVLFLAFFKSFNLSMPFIWENLPYLITQGAVTTIYISAVSLIFASIIAMIAAIAKLSSNGFAYAIASFYTSFFRGLPLLVQIYLIYLGLPQLGIFINAVPSGVLALSLCTGAYMTEIFRAGIQSIDRGQWEASRSMGFGFGLTMRRIILPQALPVIIPPMGNTFISMLKDSSLVSILGVWELTFLARTLGQPTFQHMEMLITAAIIYWIMSICLELVQSRIERHFARSKVR